MVRGAKQVQTSPQWSLGRFILVETDVLQLTNMRTIQVSNDVSSRTIANPKRVMRIFANDIAAFAYWYDL